MTTFETISIMLQITQLIISVMILAIIYALFNDGEE